MGQQIGHSINSREDRHGGSLRILAPDTSSVIFSLLNAPLPIHKATLTTIMTFLSKFFYKKHDIDPVFLPILYGYNTCTNVKCTYENYLQCAEGIYNCRGSSISPTTDALGRHTIEYCTGTYHVDAEQAEHVMQRFWAERRVELRREREKLAARKAEFRVRSRNLHNAMLEATHRYAREEQGRLVGLLHAALKARCEQLLKEIEEEMKTPRMVGNDNEAKEIKVIGENMKTTLEVCDARKRAWSLQCEVRSYWKEQEDLDLNQAQTLSQNAVQPKSILRKRGFSAPPRLGCLSAPSVTIKGI
ncbi:hypothetical protein AMATHDRAFT_42032 [Amanita thiersii Skay4041]|uniref:Uncharacterized protein n=1 Tax=Amanita thiersii Skay4041 TaxID=703135 RepID=A0A2A9NHH7_9AGAR|nr:hypothetical protein AMATHDRAFT_42032 [Amanita thiersii Skay4041]